ncbi:uncharacterized protein LOC124639816 [Helicoverpa zea]|uniref:Uncharacterized protein n=1 Tax=Lygus hesperus TaxID=30085 RepID=A0A0K8SSA0_LYGHE|nr:uncharacterized protein LOC124639816 [Helicoverpa zea]
MNSCEFFNNLDPGGPMMTRKRFKELSLEATVYQEATNLMPPLDPPQPPPMPTESVSASEPSNNFIRSQCLSVVFPARLRTERRGKRNTYVFAGKAARQRATRKRLSKKDL